VTPANRAHLFRQAKAGRALALARGIYVTGATLPPDRVALHHRFELIARFWPGAVICDRSALRGAEPDGGWLYLCHPDPSRAADLVLPGVYISVRVGPVRVTGRHADAAGLHLSGPARSLVENVSPAGRPATGRPPRPAGTAAVEDHVDAEARTGGAGRIANLRRQFDVIAGQFPQPAVDLVRRRLAAVLGTDSGERPRSTRLAARLAGAPFDQHRIDMFIRFGELLADTAPSPAALGGHARWAWLAFFEADFSNFIEGNKFGVDEARQIAIDGKIPVARPQDAHDIAATYRIASDPELSVLTTASGDELLNLLRDQHAILMAARPDKRPGQVQDERRDDDVPAVRDTLMSPRLLSRTLFRVGPV
jgi:hypothetical protein